MATATQVLTDQFAESSAKILKVLDRITDEEFFWEPCAGCWTVHRRGEVRATTIAWRTVHVAAVNYLYWDSAFGPASLSPIDLAFP